MFQRRKYNINDLEELPSSEASWKKYYRHPVEMLYHVEVGQHFFRWDDELVVKIEDVLLNGLVVVVRNLRDGRFYRTREMEFSTWESKSKRDFYTASKLQWTRLSQQEVVKV